MKESLLKRLTGLFYALVIIILTLLFFTNDFGLVDLRKTSVIIGLGLDYEDGEVALTAQLAVPQAAENGENTQFTVVTGKGKTVAGALNEVNVKTGFYPKLVFCKLILIGESCFKQDVNELLNYFYENEYTGLTPKIAACKGGAGDIMSMQLPFGDSITDSLERLLSEEAQKSGNVSTTDLNKFGQGYLSKSEAAFMPYIESNAEQPSQGGEERQSGQGGQESQGGQSGGGGQKSQGGGGGQSGEKSGKSGSSEEPLEFMCNKTAVFKKGVFAGVLDEEQAFVFNLIKNDMRHVYTEYAGLEGASALGLRSCKGGVELIIENGAPVLKLSFSAAAKLLDSKNNLEAARGDSKVSDEELNKCEDEIKKGMTSLFEFVKESGCDVLGAKDLLYKKHNKYYETFKDVLYDRLSLVCEVELRSAS